MDFDITKKRGFIIWCILFGAFLYGANCFIEYSSNYLTGIEFQCNLSTDSLANIFKQYVFSDSTYLDKYSDIKKDGLRTVVRDSIITTEINGEPLTYTLEIRHTYDPDSLTGKTNYKPTFSIRLALPDDKVEKYSYKLFLKNKSIGFAPLRDFRHKDKYKSIIQIDGFDRKYVSRLSLREQRQCKRIFKDFIKEINEKYNLDIEVVEMPTVYRAVIEQFGIYIYKFVKRLF